MAFFDVLAAKKDGWTDKDIAEALAENVGFDVNAARQDGWGYRDIISSLNETGATPFETFLQSAKQEVGSEIKGLGQITGLAELDTAEESLRRQMASENPVSGVLGTLAGGLINPSTLVPGALLFKGAKGFAAAGAVAGGIGGALDPVYEEEDSRALNAAVGLGVGTTLGGLLGVVAGKFGRKAAQDLVEKAKAKGAKNDEEIAKDIAETTGVKVDEPTTTDSFIPENTAKVEPTPAVDTPNVNVAEAIPARAEFKPLFDKIELDSVNPLAREEAEAAFNKGTQSGDWSDFFNAIKGYTAEVEFGKLPIWKIQGALDQTNPFYQRNIDTLKQWNIEKFSDGLNLLQTRFNDIQALRAPQDIDVPIPNAVAAFLGRDGLVLPRQFQQAIVPWLEKELASFQNIDTFYDDLVKSGVSAKDAAKLVSDSFNQFSIIASQVLGNRSQAARVLTDKATTKLFGNMKALTNMLENSGKALSPEDTIDMVDMVRKLKASSVDGSIDLQQATGAAAKKLIKDPTLGQKFSEAITNIYTSGIQTAVVNALSPPVKMLMNGLEAAILTATPGSSRFLDFRRAGASLSALTDAFRESLFFAKTGFLEGQALDNLGDVAGAIGRNKTKPSSKAEQILGDVIRTVGTRPSVGIDEFFKTYFRKMELYDQFYKLAYSGRFKGNEKAIYDALKKVDVSDRDWAVQLENANIPGIKESELSKIAEAAKEYAKLNTFQADLGKLGNDLLKLKSNNPAAALIIPFVKTPLNILKDGISYIPGLNLVPGVTPSRVLRDADGRIKYDSKGRPKTVSYLTKEQKLARTAIGTAAAVTLAQHVFNNEITGSYPKDPGKRAAMQAAGIPEYAIKVGDKWIPYGRVEPIATTLGFVADSMKILQETIAKNPNDRKVGEIASQVTGALANNLANKTFLQGVAGVVQAINDPERHGSAFVKGFASLAVPGAIAQFSKASDPNQRISETFGEAVLNRIPGQREQLPERYNLFGGVAQNPMQGLAGFTGVPIRSAVQTPEQKLVSDLGIDYSMPSKKLKGVQLTPEQQSRYQELSNNMLTLKLQQAVNNPYFQSLPKARQKFLVEQQLSQGRKAATNMMYAEMSRDPEFREEVRRIARMKKGLEE
jgi:hypothetical protein